MLTCNDVFSAPGQASDCFQRRAVTGCATSMSSSDMGVLALGVSAAASGPGRLLPESMRFRRLLERGSPDMALLYDSTFAIKPRHKSQYVIQPDTTHHGHMYTYVHHANMYTKSHVHTTCCPSWPKV